MSSQDQTQLAPYRLADIGLLVIERPTRRSTDQRQRPQKLAIVAHQRQYIIKAEHPTCRPFQKELHHTRWQRTLFLGFGLPPGSPSLGELLAQGKANLQAPWLGITAFVILALMLSLLIFIGEAVRDAFDPRKTLQ